MSADHDFDSFIKQQLAQPELPPHDFCQGVTQGLARQHRQRRGLLAGAAATALAIVVAVLSPAELAPIGALLTPTSTLLLLVLTALCSHAWIAADPGR